MNLRQVKSDNEYYSVIITDFSEDDVHEFFTWCRVNLQDSDIWVYKVKKEIIHRYRDGHDVVHGVSEYMESETVYQMSYITEKDLVMFQLKWADSIETETQELAKSI